MLTATKFMTDAIPHTFPHRNLSLQMFPALSHVMTKYSKVSSGTYTNKSKRSAAARLTRKAAVGDLNFPRPAHVKMTTPFSNYPNQESYHVRDNNGQECYRLYMCGVIIN